MQFNSLGKNAGAANKVAKKDVPVNLAVRLERIDIGGDKPSQFQGFLVGSDEPVTVRMMTVDEGVAVNQRKGEEYAQTKERLQKQYVGSGEVHRPRPAEVNNPNHKTHCAPGGLIMFTKCMKNEDGSYRAHWVDTMERTPGAGCDKVMAHIRVEEIKDQVDRSKVIGVQVVADVVDPGAAVVLNKGNVVETLSSVFANRNGDEKRKPFMFVRLIDSSNGKIVLPPARANAFYLAEKKRDADTGVEYTIREAASAEESITNLMGGETATQDSMMIRAALFGMGSEPGYASFNDVSNPDLVSDLKSITDGVRSGALVVEVVPGERISAGPATRASIDKAVRSNPNNPINVLYSVRNENGYTTQRRFCETYLATKIGKDGHRMFTKAVPADTYPQTHTIISLATINDQKPSSAEQAKGRAVDANPSHVNVPEGMPFDPTSLDGMSHDEINDKLSQSASQLDEELSF